MDSCEKKAQDETTKATQGETPVTDEQPRDKDPKEQPVREQTTDVKQIPQENQEKSGKPDTGETSQESSAGLKAETNAETTSYTPGTDANPLINPETKNGWFTFKEYATEPSVHEMGEIP